MLSLVSAAIACQAQAPTSPSGRLLASNCFQCHGTDGKGPGFEKLAGKSAEDIYHELAEMRAGKEGDGLMSRHAKGYTDAQLRAIAQYLASRR
jgi:cytochrome c553